MTTGQGYQDFQRTSQQVGVALVNVANAQATPVKVYGPFNVGVWAALAIYLTTNNSPSQYTLTLDWFADEAMTQPCGTWTWTASQGADIGDQAINLGPWVRFTVACTAGAGSAGFSLRATPMSLLSARGRPAPNGFLGYMPEQNIGPGVLVTTYVVQVSAGPAWFYVNSRGNFDYLSFLTAIDTPVGPQVIAESVGTSSPFSFPGGQTVYLPPSTMMITVLNNTSTSTGAFSAGLIPLF